MVVVPQEINDPREVEPMRFLLRQHVYLMRLALSKSSLAHVSRQICPRQARSVRLIFEVRRWENIATASAISISAIAKILLLRFLALSSAPLRAGVRGGKNWLLDREAH